MNVAHQTSDRSHGRITLFHALVVVASLMVTLTAWQYSKIQVDRKTQLAYEAARDQALGLIVDRMAKYEDALWAGVAAVESHGRDIAYRDWKAFAQTLRIEERYPGINGIGIIHFLPTNALSSYLAKHRFDRRDFRVFPPHDQPMNMPITFVEPEAGNAAAVGLDIAHETNRRTAALASRDTGLARITAPITLVQDADQTAGFLFYAPFYRAGIADSVDGRQAGFLGTVYAPFVVHRLMEGLLDQGLRDIHFSITDAEELIYDEHDAQDASFDPNPLFSEQVSLELYGRTWTLDMRTDLGFRENNTVAKPIFILIAGLFIEALIITLLVQMSRANHRAVSYADEVTVALRAQSNTLAKTNVELSAKNQELEQFAYIASHDLKTPMRGIAGLTELVEEDLEEYFASAEANPDVAKNLQRIHDRLQRMDTLTRSIMEYAQIGAKTDENGPLALDEFVVVLALDFGLDEDQIQLSGDVKLVETDTFHLRRILENLVGNAVKYHDGNNRLRIRVKVHSTGDTCRVSVSDNGPGIAPEFHTRIFDVFQTLQSTEGSDSTGIGLSIVKKAVERHGHDVTLTSAVGHGSTFTFDWPNEPARSPSEIIDRAA
ncbi:MAG: CHASE domain-containing protein [Paracoccaceae bacterium]